MTANRPLPLDFQHVSKTFSIEKRTVEALKQLSLTIEENSVTALVGPDGAGKTTLLRLAAGLYLPNTGQIRIFGYDTRQYSDQIHVMIGYMPQRFGLYEDLTVAENLNLYADLHHVSMADRQYRFDDLMVMTGLSAFTDRLAGKLSGGMKQKLGLACTLLSEPRLLLLDEPSVGVDPVSRRELWRIIQHQVKQKGTTVLLSTAYMDEAERCDKVVLVDDGEILAQDTPEHFKAHLSGHCFRLQHTRLTHRQLQSRLHAFEDIIDSIIQGESVRVVCRQTKLPDFPADIAEHLKISPAEAGLEDAFISLLRRRHPTTPQPPLQLNHINSKNHALDVIRVEQVDRWFGQFQAVKKLNFSVKRGEIFGLLGANGAGKTTTFRMLCGLLPVSNGQLSVAGVDLRTAAAKARAKIGYMSQKFSLYANLSVQQNLDFFSSAYGLKNQRRKQRIQWAVEQFDLKKDLNSNSGDLPLGYKQRLAMACALMHEPEILFLDEPTSGVDPLARREFWARTNQLAANGVTVLVTTHFMEEAEYCDRLVIMVQGEVLMTGSPAEIKQQAITAECPEPTMEQAFIHLVEKNQS
ncbi:ATP-binding cassette domain-containing protein [methane-oxidizing endosymbiont of Gigantopelta aegis]|uniref:ATP-binding cassette domain-containing protein n=1 Tax=methane-oxidizing endosymbiont of Gigantopelta aegis TaxID=2794938 RepID=UPI0018DCCF64|nr:ATP-binding cassette domain-containing protein [methane-oxidizing endosymbiont of Gigantopelta aegis]